MVCDYWLKQVPLSASYSPHKPLLHSWKDQCLKFSGRDRVDFCVSFIIDRLYDKSWWYKMFLKLNVRFEYPQNSNLDHNFIGNRPPLHLQSLIRSFMMIVQPFCRFFFAPSPFHSYALRSFFDSYFTSFEQEEHDPASLDCSFDDFPPIPTQDEPAPSHPASSSSASSSCPSEAATPVPPDIGPFLNAVFSMLESMLDNDFQVNLQLTGLVAKLAAFPHPLLRNFLLYL